MCDFQTNLYALQESGGNNNFVPPTTSKIKAFFAVDFLSLRRCNVIMTVGLSRKNWD